MPGLINISSIKSKQISQDIVKERILLQVTRYENCIYKDWLSAEHICIISSLTGQTFFLESIVWSVYVIDTINFSLDNGWYDRFGNLKNSAELHKKTVGMFSCLLNQIVVYKTSRMIHRFAEKNIWNELEVKFLVFHVDLPEAKNNHALYKILCGANEFLKMWLAGSISNVPIDLKYQACPFYYYKGVLL